MNNANTPAQIAEVDAFLARTIAPRAFVARLRAALLRDIAKQNADGTTAAIAAAQRSARVRRGR